MARELHDVIAHCMSVMVVQTQAARSIASADIDAARSALRAVEQSGREALVELRRIVGALRRQDEELTDSAAPGLGQLEALADRARAAGLRSRFKSSAGLGRCHRRSTWSPTGSCRRRSRTRSSTPAQRLPGLP